jgi:RNA polymerase sigma factor (sigma-70 family)
LSRDTGSGVADDRELVRDAQSGNNRAFNEIVLKYRKSVYLTAVGLINDADEADDIAQDVFVKAYESISTFRGESALYTWLYRITVNLSLNRIRKRKARSFFGLEQVAQTLAAPDADEPAELNELNIRLRRAIAELPEKQRAVFILRHFRELPHAEIAQIMDRDVGTIKANYFQAVQKLRKKLGSYVKSGE